MHSNGTHIALEEREQENSDEPKNPWSYLPLKDRIGPLISENATLRLNHDRHEADKDQGTPPFDDRNVDAVLTPDVCGSIMASLIASQKQLAEMGTTQSYPGSTRLSTEESINTAHARPPTEVTHPPTESSVLPSFYIPDTTSNPMPSSSLQSSVPRISHDNPLGVQQAMHSNRDQKQTMPVAASAAPLHLSPRSSQAYSASSTHTQENAIPIPILPMFFNQTSSQQIPEMSSRSNGVSPEHPKNDEHRSDGFERSRNRSPSPNPWPHKRLRSLSPPASISNYYYKEKNRSHGEDGNPPSPPPYRRGHSPSTSTSLLYRKHSQLSLRASRRSRSPRSRRSRSRSPRRQWPSRYRAGYSSGSLPQLTSTNYHESLPHHTSSKPQSTREYIYSRHLRTENSEVSSSPALLESAHEQYPSSKNFKEFYLTDIRERCQENSKIDVDRECDGRRRYSGTWEDDRGRQCSRLSAGQTGAPTQTPAGATVPPRVLLTPPASAASINDRTPIKSQRTEGEQSANMGDSTTSAMVGTRVSAGTHAQSSAEQGEVPDAEVLESAPIPDAEKGGTPLSWKPFNDIPGIWFLKEGSSEPDVFECTITVTREIALKWGLPLLEGTEDSITESQGSHPMFKRKSLPQVSWKLKCVSTEHWDAVQHTLVNPVSAKELVHELSRFESRWPAGGKLIIEVNPGHGIGKTFYAKHLVNAFTISFSPEHGSMVLKDSVIPFLELKNHIHEGSNLVRFIQLEDMSKHAFILYATPTPKPLAEDSVSPRDGLEVNHEFSLDDLHHVLQKSRADNGPTPTPVFMVQDAKVKISFPQE